MSLSIGPLQPHEAAAFCDLFSRVFGVERSVAWRDWKYAQGPRLEAFSIVARDDAGALRGHAGALVFPGSLAGRSLPMAQVCDVMVDAGVRGGIDAGGVYGRLMHALQRALAQRFPEVFAYGFPGLRPYRLGARMGLYRCVQACAMGRLPAPAVAAQPLARAVLAFAGRCTLSALPVSFGDPALGDAWARRSARLPGPVVARTLPYLHWRYAAHPLHRYQAWMLRRWGGRGRPLGWLVTRAMPSGATCVVDSLLAPGLAPHRAAQSLAAALARTPRTAGAPCRPCDDPATPAPAGAADIESWHFATPESRQAAPIMGCEIFPDLSAPALRGAPAPRFQPGDTDVF